METKSKFYQTLFGKPFLGWKIFVYLFFIPIPWMIIKEELAKEGIFLGGIPSVLVIFTMMWIMARIVNYAGNKEISFDKLKDIPKKLKTTPLFILVIAIIALAVFWNYHSQTQKNELGCLKEIEYRVSKYRIYENNKYRYFKTHDEAMDYCIKIMRVNQ